LARRRRQKARKTSALAFAIQRLAMFNRQCEAMLRKTKLAIPKNRQRKENKRRLQIPQPLRHNKNPSEIGSHDWALFPKPRRRTAREM